jgi:ketopantoate reductase
MRIAVIGAGAVGSALGSLLWRAGEEVVLVGRAAHVAALREDRAMPQDAPIVVLQNGLRGDELAATVVPESQLVSGVVVLHAQYLVAGHVVNVLPALCDASFKQVYQDRFLRRLAVGLMREGLAVAQRSGIRLESLPGTSVPLVRLVAYLPDALAGAVAAHKAAGSLQPQLLISRK